MSATVSQASASLSNPAPASSLRAVPVAVWALMGVLALAAAGMGGALVMKSVDAQPTASGMPAPMAVAAAQPAMPDAAAPQAVAQAPAQPVVQAPPVQAQAVKPAQAKPAPTRTAQPRPAEPAPSPQAVAQAPAQPAWNPPVETRRAAVCATCGTVESVQAFEEKGQGSGLGAVGGAVVGGLLGNQVGGGNGKKVATVIGAVGGGLAGHEVEKRVRSSTVYQVRVRMDDGSVRTVQRAEPVAAGSPVVVEGDSLRAVQRGGVAPAAPAAPRVIHTRQAAGEGA